MKSRPNTVKCLSADQKLEMYTKFTNKDYKTKTKLGKEFKVSLRTVNRVLDEMTNFKPEYDYTVTKNQITLFTGSDTRSIQQSYPKFKKLHKMLSKGNFSQEVLHEVWNLMEVSSFIEKFSEGNITVDHEQGKVWYGTFEIKNSIVDRMMDMLGNKEDVSPLVKFLDKLLQNPKKNIVEELYPFLEYNDIEISDQGDILAYRGIRPDWKDHHSGTMDNSIGNILSMPRTLVDDNPERTCSSGLHCSSFEYANSFKGSGRLIKVKVCPSNVVSVPVDYNGQKLRCCKFEVLEEII